MNKKAIIGTAGVALLVATFIVLGPLAGAVVAGIEMVALGQSDIKLEIKLPQKADRRSNYVRLHQSSDKYLKDDGDQNNQDDPDNGDGDNH